MIRLTRLVRWPNLNKKSPTNPVRFSPKNNAFSSSRFSISKNNHEWLEPFKVFQTLYKCIYANFYANFTLHAYFRIEILRAAFRY